jgi:hypothetical protein
MFREREFAPDISLYVVDHRQGEHFTKLFAVLQKLGYDRTDFRHISFGTVMGSDGKPFKTRSGSTVGLESMLDEAVSRAMEVVCDPTTGASGQMDQAEQQLVAETVGLGAIKYADLSHNRTSNYIFDMDKMVRLEGNTSAYIQYSYARIKSILRKAEEKGWKQAQWELSPMDLTQGSELALALHLVRFEEMLQQSSSGKTCQESSTPKTMHSAAFLEHLPVKMKRSSHQGKSGQTLVVCLVPKEQSRGESLMPNISEWPNAAAVCSLSQVLETTSIPQRFFLSSRACAGILRRADKRGKLLPPSLQAALESVVSASTVKTNGL